MKFDYKIKGIETRYNGINFRSRLEAKWARFFDLLNWKWEYEPCDFNGWIPDFVLIGTKEQVFVEVKPLSNFEDDTANEIMRQIDKSGCGDDCLLLGLSLVTIGNEIVTYYGQIVYTINLGYLSEKPSGCWNNATFGKWIGSESESKNLKKVYGFCHEIMSFHDRITGCRDGGTTRGDYWSIDDYDNVMGLWKEACNTTQWNPKN